MAGRMTVTVTLDTTKEQSVEYDVEIRIGEGFKDEFEPGEEPSDFRLVMTALAYAVARIAKAAPHLPIEKFAYEFGTDIIQAACTPRERL